MTLDFDHIAIGADTLAHGAAWVVDRLGVDVPVGGANTLMATHNRVTALGLDSYLEIIALAPAAPAPPRVRWFALDAPAQQERLRAQPEPIAWVARTTDLDAALARARTHGLDLGHAVDMTRGSLRWRISVRDDGSLPESGALPVLIEWPQGAHPASRMEDLGLRLKGLRIYHPDPEWLRSALADLGADRLAEVKEATARGLEVVVHAPVVGDVVLR